MNNLLNEKLGLACLLNHSVQCICVLNDYNIRLRLPNTRGAKI